jgi:UDP-3-O-[3-hydroxymyristoyl] glucosamine N-acyltransferase
VPRAVSWTLGEIGERLDLAVQGDSSLRIDGVRTLDEAGPHHLACLHHPRYRAAALASRAGALLTGPEVSVGDARPRLVSPEPYLALARVVALFHPETPPAAGVHPSAHLGDGVVLGEGVTVAPLAVVGDRVRLADGVRVGAGSVIEADCELGEGTVVHANVTLYPRTRVGARCVLHGGVVLGADGFGFATRKDGVHEKMPHVGRVIVEDDVEIGAGSTVDRGSLGDTVIGAGTKIDDLVMVAHNVKVGAGCLLVAQSGLSGSTRLGRGVVIAGQSGAAGHLDLGDGATVAAKTAVFADVPAGSRVAGAPALPMERWRRAAAIFARLPEMRSELRRLREEVQALRRAVGPEEDA